MSYERILNFIIRKFKSAICPQENGSKKLLMEKANLLMEKASHGPRNVVQIFIVMGALTALHTALQSLCIYVL